MGEEQTAYHLLVSCGLVDEELRSEMNSLISLCNDAGEGSEEMCGDYISILNCTRNSNFISNCLQIVQCNKLELRTKYIISY